MKAIKRRLRKCLRKWLGISSNLDTMLNLIIVDGNNRIKALEDNSVKIHLLEGKIDSIKEEIKPIKDNSWKFKSWDSNIKDICKELNKLRNEEPRGTLLSKILLEMIQASDDNKRRIDRLEEVVCGVIAKLPSDRVDIKWLIGKSNEMYEEQAAAKGEIDE